MLSLPTILKINNGLNGCAPELVNGYRPEYVDHRNLDGIYTDVFWGLRERKKSLKEIFNEIWPLVRNNNL